MATHHDPRQGEKKRKRLWADIHGVSGVSNKLVLA